MAAIIKYAEGSFDWWMVTESQSSLFTRYYTLSGFPRNYTFLARVVILLFTTIAISTPTIGGVHMLITKEASVLNKHQTV